MRSPPRSQASGPSQVQPTGLLNWRITPIHPELRPHASDMVRVFEVSLTDAQSGIYRYVCFMALSILSLPPGGGSWHAKRDGRSLAAQRIKARKITIFPEIQK